MFPFVRNKTVQVKQTTTPSGQPGKSYQLVRSSSASTKNHSSTTATTIRRPSVGYNPSSSSARPVKDTFRPLEGEDLPLGPYRGERLGSNSATYHPLPPIIHQRQPAMVEPNMTMLLEEGGLGESHSRQSLQPHSFDGLPAPANHHEWPDRGHTPLLDMEPQHARVITRGHTPLLDMEPQHARVITRAPKPKLKPVVRVHARPTSQRATSKVRGSDGRYYYYSGASNSTSDNSRRTRSSEEWETDSWSGDGETEWGSQGVWSDADSWDGKTQVRTIGPGRGELRAIEEVGGRGRGGKRIEGGGWGRDVRRVDDRGWAPEKKRVHYVD